MKTDDTKRLEMEIWNATNKQGVFGCFEVTIGWYGKERVDYMTYDTKGVFRCYEVKVTKADFRSRRHNSFVGHLNYYVLPSDLYEEVKAEIPEHVGVYIERSGFLHSIKKAKRRAAENPDEEKYMQEIQRVTELYRSMILESVVDAMREVYKDDTPPPGVDPETGEIIEAGDEGTGNQQTLL